MSLLNLSETEYAATLLRLSEELRIGESCRIQVETTQDERLIFRLLSAEPSVSLDALEHLKVLLKSLAVDEMGLVPGLSVDTVIDFAVYRRSQTLEIEAKGLSFMVGSQKVVFKERARPLDLQEVELPTDQIHLSSVHIKNIPQNYASVYEALNCEAANLGEATIEAVTTALLSFSDIFNVHLYFQIEGNEPTMKLQVWVSHRWYDPEPFAVKRFEFPL